jgi:hypothetical protein
VANGGIAWPDVADRAYRVFPRRSRTVTADQQSLNVTLGVEYRDNRERFLVDAIGKNRPKAKLGTRREVFSPVPLPRRSGKRAKPGYKTRRRSAQL